MTHYLIIEDDPGIRQILQDVLHRLEQSATFTSLGDGHQAWQWLDQVQAQGTETVPDIAFVDLKMPGPQGYEVAERMRALPSLSTLGIVLMSAHEMTPDEFQEVMQRSQADRFIHKPLPGAKGLNQIIEEIMAIRHHRARE